MQVQCIVLKLLQVLSDESRGDRTATSKCLSTSEICPPTKIQEIVSNAYLLNGHISKTIDTSYMFL
jgi:hypothetical protein